VLEAGGQDLGADPLGDLFRGAGEAEAVGELVGRAAQCFGDVATFEGGVDRLDLARLGPRPLAPLCAGSASRNS
jgi:hypothetical protein